MIATIFSKRFYIHFFVFATCFSCISWTGKYKSTTIARDAWVDSVFAALTPEQRLGQLFMLAAYSNKDEKHFHEIDSMITNYHIGGLIFMQGGPLRQARLNNRFQALSKVPLLMAIDGEWGLSMRLDSTPVFPKQMTLGALQDNSLIYKMGEEIARECKRIGIHMNFAPVIDINSNPSNPVIGFRSFGETKEMVTEKGIAYMKGMQNSGVMACAKHFPGHGDTDSDSHFTLPVIRHSKKRIEDIELYPFKELIKDSIASIMVAHIHIPAYNATPNQATTLSKEVVSDLLKNQLKYNGLIITDALNMKGVAKFYKPGEVDVLALLAGNDMLLFSEDMKTAFANIAIALKEGKLKQADLDERVKKILRAKYWCGLNKYEPVKLQNLYEDLNNKQAKSIRYELYKNSVTVISNKNDLLPISKLDTSGYYSVSIGSVSNNSFSHLLSKYAYFNHLFIPQGNSPDTTFERVSNAIPAGKTVIIGLHFLTNSVSKNFGLTERCLSFIRKLHATNKVILVVFGNAYSLKNFEYTSNLICAYEDNDATRRSVPQLIFGAYTSKAKIPVTVSSIKYQTGIELPDLKRLQYPLFPEMAGMDAKILKRIDSIALKAIHDHAMPGCQILVAHKGMVVYDKEFGKLTYDTAQSIVNDSTLYDLASVTKVGSTLQAVMRLKNEGKLCLDSIVSAYLPELKNTNKGNLIIREILAHQAGLPPFLEHWKKTMSGHQLKDIYYCDTKDHTFSKLVSKGIYSVESLHDSVWKWTVESALMPKHDTCYAYKYSDISFYIMHRIVERLSNEPIENYVYRNFYQPLGMYNTTFNPTVRFRLNRIAPTETDNYFRFSEIRGTVHDQGAAMYGGVAGHAGLFSNANDLAILMQMNLQDGEYGGTRYFEQGTVYDFARRNFKDNRRGLGWDKPNWDGGGPTSVHASQRTFGHSGFTGTCVWIDPKYNLVFVFLSNRTFPSAENKKLITQNIRTKIQDVIYDAMK